MAKAFQIKGSGITVNKLSGSGTTSAAPVIVAAGTGAGTSPTISIVGNNIGGTITLTTGSTPAASAIVATVTFSSAFDAAPAVGLDPANVNAAGLSGTSVVFADSASTTTTVFVLKSGSTALPGATQYIWTYSVIGNG
jgi:hypothetical protein